MEKDDIIKEVIAIIRRHLPGEEFKILLFGSWAKGSAESSSDIDIGIMGPESVDDMFLSRLKSEIGGIPTMRGIDIVDLNKTDERFRKEVLSYGKVL